MAGELPKELERSTRVVDVEGRWLRKRGIFPSARLVPATNEFWKLLVSLTVFAFKQESDQGVELVAAGEDCLADVPRDEPETVESGTVPPAVWASHAVIRDGTGQEPESSGDSAFGDEVLLSLHSLHCIIVQGAELRGGGAGATPAGIGVIRFHVDMRIGRREIPGSERAGDLLAGHAREPRPPVMRGRCCPPASAKIHAGRSTDWVRAPVA